MTLRWTRKPCSFGGVIVRHAPSRFLRHKSGGWRSGARTGGLTGGATFRGRSDAFGEAALAGGTFEAVGRVGGGGSVSAMCAAKLVAIVYACDAVDDASRC